MISHPLMAPRWRHAAARALARLKTAWAIMMP
jgi:hypothetical protein